MKMSRMIIWLSLLSLGFQMGERAPMVDTITKERMRADIAFLASEGLQGRMTATPGDELAAEFIATRFQRAGLKPAGPGGTYYQSFNLMTAGLGEENRLEVVTGENQQLRLHAGQDFYPQRFSGSGQAVGSLVYAGFGISAPALKYDDYGTADLKGKIVLVLDHEPGERDPNRPFDGLVSSVPSDPLRKALAAQAHGAAGILYVDDVHNHPGPANFEAAYRASWPAQPPRFERYSLALWVEKVRIPAAQISTVLADILLQASGRRLEDLSRAAETAAGMGIVPIPGPQVILTTDVQRHVVPDRNVVGMVEGSDPRLKEEWIILCAHYDHNGAEPNQYYPGADDDASGIAGLVEMAEAYIQAAAAGQGPRRSILFAAWDTEERGLLGAWAYAENPLQPLPRTIAVLNMDMIGRNEEVPEGADLRFRGLDRQTAESNSNALNVLGTHRSADLRAETEKANRTYGLELKFRYDNNLSNLLRRSDHWPFLQKGVPALWFLTGLHPDYHTIYDRTEKINYVKLEKIARMIYQMSWNLAQQESRPKFNGPMMLP
jgi:Zn-dependent M28 family amino/carboxypeptidase